MRMIHLILALLLSSPLLAQLPLRSPTISAGAQLAIPRGEFGDLYKDTPFGVNASISLPVFKSPLEWGGGFSWNQIGADARDVIIADEFGGYQDGELRLVGNAYTYHVHARLRPFNGRVRPYGELLAGFRNYSTKSKFYFENQGEGVEPFTEVSDRDFTWVSGWALGLQYRILPGFFLEGRFEKLRGDRAEYINPESIEISRDGAYSYDMQESRTDQFTISIGLALNF